MFSDATTIIATYFDRLTDGTLRTAADFCASDRERLEPLCTQTRTGYLQIRNTDLPTHGIDEYRAIVTDDARWAPFVQAKLEPYFTEHLDLTADGGATPEALIRLDLGRIEGQFPGGLGLDYGDQDVRDLIAAKGLVMYHDYHHLTASRRLHIAKLYRYAAAVAVLAVLWLAAAGMFHVHAALPVLAIVLPLAVLAFHLMSILTRRRHRMYGDQFNAAVRQSAATVSKCAIIRQDALIFASHAMFEIANSGKEDYWAQGRLKAWTEVNEKWFELIFWLNGRVAANASFAFIRSKLIGLSLQGLRAEAQFEALVLTTRWLALLAVPAAASLLWLVTAPADVAAVYGYIGWMSWQFVRLHGLIDASDTPEAITEVLAGDSLRRMKGHPDARLHEEVARFMKREKLKQLYAERTRLNSGVTEIPGLV